MKDWIDYHTPEIFGCLFAIMFLSIFLLFAEITATICKNYNSKKDFKEYTNGCECGGNWQYQQAVGTFLNGVQFMYECDNCGEIKVFSEKYKEEK